MKRLALQSLVVLSVTTCFLSSAQAGVIPWVYDVIFGPVRQPGYYPAAGYGPASAQPVTYGYSPYSYSPYSYSPYSYSPYKRCSTCAPAVSASRAVSRCSTGRCATGGCPTTIAYYPAWPVGYTMVRSQCASVCSASTTDWRASDSPKNRTAPDPQTTYVKEKDPFIGADKPPRPQPEQLPVTKVQPEPAVVTAPTVTGSGATAASKKPGAGSVIEQIRKDNWEETGKSRRPVDASRTKDVSRPAETGTAVDPAGETEVVAPVRKDAQETEETNTPAAATVAPLIKDEASPVIKSEASKDGAGFGKTRRGDELPARLPDPRTKDAADSTNDGSGSESGEPQVDEAVPLENEQNKTSWKFTQPVRRIVLRASFRNVRIARRSATIHADDRIPAASLTQIAGR